MRNAFLCPMVLGSGLIARAFNSFLHDDRVLVFASGVSNSSSATPADYAREKELLLAQEGISARLVYFSTCSLHDPTLHAAGYIRHKRLMEGLIREQFADHLIIRLPNVVGHTPNPYTLTNFLRDRIMAGEPFHVQAKACRYLMDVDTVALGCPPMMTRPEYRGTTIDACLDKPVPVPQLVKAMEQLLNRQAVTTEIEAGSCYHVDNTAFKQAWSAHAGLPWPGPDQWVDVLRKYYGGASGTE